MASQYWKDMFIPLTKDVTEGIISTDEPSLLVDPKRKIELIRGIKTEEYDKMCDFIKAQNQTASGNTTLLPKSELMKYLRFDARVVLMRGIKDMLVGTVLSIPLPIRCTLPCGSTDDELLLKDQTIIHGCTSFLNIHKFLRNNNLAMTLIRELLHWAYEDSIYCGYCIGKHKIGAKSFPITAWYRPLNFPRSIGLGFTVPDWNIPVKFAEHRVKYACKAPTGYKIIRVSKANQERALKIYQRLGENKKFIFWPDLTLFAHWIQEFPTYMVKRKADKKIVGIYSINTLFCRMGGEMDGTLCIPLLFNCLVDSNNVVLKCLISTANEREHDTLYLYQTGDITKEALLNNNCIETKDKTRFSVYNNAIDLSADNISVPLL